jgi:hypothetical protein
MSNKGNDRSKSLGNFYPYYCTTKAGAMYLHPNLISLLTMEGCRMVLDEHAVLQVLNRYFMFGDRTIFRDIKRAPWMAKRISDDDGWYYHCVPPHGMKNDLTEDQVAEKLFELLCKEIALYIANHRRVGILLSGGMDSRIVAAVLNHLIKKGEIAAESVTAYTWGVDDCRDVVYSKNIAKMFGWKMQHHCVDAEDLWENFKIAGERGCEYTGLHLHAIPQISRNISSELDVMLAGSYGDSIGRAEYSKKLVTSLSPIQRKIRNPSFLLKSTIYNCIKDGWIEDVNRYHKFFPRDKQYQVRELDFQLHYMRRMINPCMEMLNEKLEMYQAFTHPDVFGYMWNLHPDLRNDRVYERLLEHVNPDLLNIPWARTGLRYPLKTGEPDSYRKNHHNYVKFIQVDLIDRIQARLFGHEAIRNGIINHDSVRSVISLIRKKTNYNFDYLEKIAWLVSYTYLTDRFNFKIQNIPDQSALDMFNAKVWVPLEYRARHTYRMIRNKLLT